MKVAIIGGTGFVGSYLIERLRADGHTPRLLVRPGSESKVDRPDGCERVTGTVADPQALADCLQGTSAVIYLIGILREFPARGITFEALQYQGVVDTLAAARLQGVPRFILMSANGIRADGTAYQRTKWRAEEAVKAAGLRWTIFRPSVIFGDPRGRMEFCDQLKRDIILSPLPAPLFFPGLLPLQAGRFELAPVSVIDVAAAFAQALTDPRTESQTYCLCGPDRLSWKAILTTIAAACGRSKWMLPAPAVAVKAAAALLDRYPWFPITRDQIEMLLEGNVCSGDDGLARLGIRPQRFAAPALDYLKD
ncbi:SDR family oxidoreductase [Candidatus Thiodictyon syntrophicum]|jgi:NADH dehydrogenase|uniref:Epimerase n=1 Tax=Candidatus Thiodictyon syntrophicum TaxID=1166950 RepID=A0A2K8U7A3_9GAMM|nr:NAD(P)H-binding protein [Candidatus Thiodictyon syntrophicum]AUB81425.1 epimerase [Candidatus Thiodictyon syntrophicum]